MRRIPIDSEFLATPGEFALPDDAAHYVSRVLRLEPGEPIELFDGQGHAAVATLLDDGAVRTDEIIHVPQPTPSIVLYHAPPKGDRWEWLLEKATELGVDEIRPLETARSVVRLPKSKAARKLERWRSIVTSAARQSGRYHTPKVLAPQSLAGALENAPGGFFGDPRASEGLTEALEAPHPETIALWVGPEGGWADEEEEQLRDAGVLGITVGKRVLRSETAGIFLVGVARMLTESA